MGGRLRPPFFFLCGGRPAGPSRSAARLASAPLGFRPRSRLAVRGGLGHNQVGEGGEGIFFREDLRTARRFIGFLARSRETVIMRTQELIQLLQRFDPDSQVRLCLSLPGRVIQTHEGVWVADYGGGPQINAATDYRPFTIYIGCGMGQLVHKVPEPPPEPPLDLGQYASAEIAARVRDFYVLHRGLDQPLSYPEFDYEDWIPPRTVSGEYNERIAEILREKLLGD